MTAYYLLFNNIIWLIFQQFCVCSTSALIYKTISPNILLFNTIICRGFSTILHFVLQEHSLSNRSTLSILHFNIHRISANPSHFSTTHQTVTFQHFSNFLNCRGTFFNEWHMISNRHSFKNKSSTCNVETLLTLMMARPGPVSKFLKYPNLARSYCFLACSITSWQPVVSKIKNLQSCALKIFTRVVCNTYI